MFKVGIEKKTYIRELRPFLNTRVSASHGFTDSCTECPSGGCKTMALDYTIYASNERCQLQAHIPYLYFFCKTLEHIVASSITKHLSKLNIFYELQHGFREKRSCESQLLMLVDDLFQSVYKKKQKMTMV